MSFLARVNATQSDTWPTLNHASDARYIDGEVLYKLSFREQGVRNADQAATTIYLLGYVAEIVLKVAYVRVQRPIVSASEDLLRPRGLFRGQAQNSIMALVGGNLHSLRGWLGILAAERAQNGFPFSPVFYGQLRLHVLTIDSHWAEWLRYRSLRATVAELDEAKKSVEWLYSNRKHLWRP